MRRLAIHSMIRQAFRKEKSKTEVLAKALLKIIGDYANKEGVDTRDLIEAIYDKGVKSGFFKFSGDVLIEISGTDVELKDGKKIRRAYSPQIKVFGKEGNEYIQAGLIQKMTLVANAEDMHSIFEVTYPEHPLLSDMVKKSVEKSSQMLKKAGANITYRKIEAS